MSHWRQTVRFDADPDHEPDQGIFLLEFLSLRKKANSVIILRDQLAHWRFAVSE